MRLESIRRSLVGSVLVVVAALTLGSCGGGGAGSPGPQGGPPQILPATGTLYAGVEYTFTAAGGRPPYFLSSSEASVLPVPFSIEGHTFSVIPANTGVINTGLTPEALPVRSVTLTMRDSVGSTATAEVQVAQNFLTGYDLFFQSNCVASSTGGAPPLCAGGETVVTLTAVFGGNLYGNRQYRFEIVRGPISFSNISGVAGITPPSGTLGPGGATWTTRTDHEGKAQAIIRVNQNVGTQIAVIRVVDVASGASSQHAVNIIGVPLSGNLTAIPDNFTLAGPNSASCGTGSGDFQVFDGTPPYTAVSTLLLVEALDHPNTNVSTSQPGHFRFTAVNPFTCIDPGTIIVRDANNRQVTVEVTTEAGEGDPPPTPIIPTPGSLTLGCGLSGSVILTGGGESLTASSPDPRVTVTASGRVLTITRVAIDPVGVPVSPTPGVVNPMAFSVNITDGTQLESVGITAPSNCPP